MHRSTLLLLAASACALTAWCAAATPAPPPVPPPASQPAPPPAEDVTRDAPPPGEVRETQRSARAPLAPGGRPRKGVDFVKSVHEMLGRRFRPVATEEAQELEYNYAAQLERYAHAGELRRSWSPADTIAYESFVALRDAGLLSRAYELSFLITGVTFAPDGIVLSGEWRPIVRKWKAYEARGDDDRNSDRWRKLSSQLRDADKQHYRAELERRKDAVERIAVVCRVAPGVLNLDQVRPGLEANVVGAIVDFSFGGMLLAESSLEYCANAGLHVTAIAVEADRATVQPPKKAR